MTLLLVVILGSVFTSAAVTATTTLVGLDPNTIGFLNAVLNLIITYYVVNHKRTVDNTVLPQVAEVKEKVEHVDAVVNSTIPGGQRHTDPKGPPPRSWNPHRGA